MSVIPLAIEDPSPTVVRREEDFDLNGDAMLILSLDENQLRGDQCNASYDLRVGRAYKDHRERERYTLREGEGLTVLPGGALLIETEEEIWLPKGMFAYIVPKVGLLQDGLSNTVSKVDPGYHDHLVVTVFNLGKKEIPLKQGQRFCALVAHHVGDRIKPYTGPGKAIEGRVGGSWLLKQWDRIEARPALLGVISLVLSLLVVFGELAVHAWMYTHPHHSEPQVQTSDGIGK